MTGTESQAVAFGTEAPYYNAIGLDTIVMGPGSIQKAHQPDEYIEIKTLNPAVDIIRQLIVPAVEAANLPALKEGQKLSYEVKADERSGKSSAVDLANAE